MRNFPFKHFFLLLIMSVLFVFIPAYQASAGPVAAVLLGGSTALGITIIDWNSCDVNIFWNCTEPVNGACGDTSSASGINTCSSGTLGENHAQSGGIYDWYCMGIDGGADSDLCRYTPSASQSNNGACGDTSSASGINTCSSGTLGENHAQSGGIYDWYCMGIDGGADSDLCRYTPSASQCSSSCGGWSSCSVSCGGGSQSRTCTRSDCSTYSESQSCNTQCCPVNGGWSGWGDWSSCSVSCGGGEQSRSRSCDSPSPSCGGSYCSGARTNSRSCNTQCCPVDGGWSDWGDWSSCSVSCGEGEQSRSRSCNSPSPSCGGADCSGSSTASQSCDNQDCPPTLDFSSSATNIFEGWDVILSWATTWVTSCTATGGWSGSKAAGGSSETVTPPVPSATYDLQCSGPGGSIQKSVTVNVAPLLLPDWREIIPR